MSDEWDAEARAWLRRVVDAASPNPHVLAELASALRTAYARGQREGVEGVLAVDDGQAVTCTACHDMARNLLLQRVRAVGSQGQREMREKVAEVVEHYKTLAHMHGHHVAYDALRALEADLPIPGDTPEGGCKRCGKPKAHPAQVYCGAVCSAQAEAGE